MFYLAEKGLLWWDAQKQELNMSRKKKGKKKCKIFYNKTNKLLETVAKGSGQAPLIWNLPAKIASAFKCWWAGRNESLAAETTGWSILFCMKLEGKIHDHNGHCCLKIPIWNKPLFVAEISYEVWSEIHE